MKLHHIIPFSLKKNLGKAYNEAMALIPDGDWALITDYDVLILTPETIPLIYKYIEKYPDTGMFISLTNRIGSCSKSIQCLDGIISDDTNILNHINKAKALQEKPIRATRVRTIGSGFLMVISKDTWNRVKFSEDRLCLGVDNDIFSSMMGASLPIRKMESVYVFHTYRLDKGIKNKSHLL